MRKSVMIILTLGTLAFTASEARLGSGSHAIKTLGQGTVNAATGEASNSKAAAPSASYKNRYSKSPSKSQVKDSHDRYAN